MKKETKYILIAITLFILFIMLCFTYSIYADYKDMQIFNKYQKTDYTYSEWYWGEYTIKEYHEGKKIRLEMEEPKS